MLASYYFSSCNGKEVFFEGMRTVLRAARQLGARTYSKGVEQGLTDEQRCFVSAARQFAAAYFEPNASKWDKEKIFPVDALREGAKLGFGGLYCSAPLGGTALSRLDASLIFEQLASSDPSTTAYLTIHNMCVWMLDSFGLETTKKELVPALCSMDKFASYCLTEASSGSDAGSLRTKAVLTGDYYTVTGSKAFISGAGTSDVYLVMVRTGGDDSKGISCLVIDKDSAGLSFGKNESKLGWNSQPTRTLLLDRVQVPKSRLLGKEGEGFKIAMKGLDGGRVNIATCSVGSAQRCFDLAVQYCKERKQFQQPIAEFQSTQFKLAEMASKIYISRLAIRNAARAIDERQDDATTLCAMAKMCATERCYEVVDDALQLHGGYGYLQDFPIERHLRDLRVHRILEGTNEVMRMIVARAVLKG